MVLLWGLTLETYEGCRYFRGVVGVHWAIVARLIISVIWTCGAGVALALGLRRDLSNWRLAAATVGAAGIALLLGTAIQSSMLGWTPFFNVRFVACAAAALSAGVSVVGLRISSARLSPEERAVIAPLGFIAVVLLLGTLTQETYEACFYYRATLGTHWNRWAQMAISLVWSVFSTGLLIGGINRRYQPLRISALALLSATIVKVFLLDLGFLDGTMRMLSLAGLGVALIFISWLYSRYGNEEEGRQEKSDESHR
jgi:uncharacterized membrane protein